MPPPTPTPVPASQLPAPTPTPVPASPAPAPTPTPVPASPGPAPTPTPVPASPAPAPTPTPVLASPGPAPTPTPVPASPAPAPTPTPVPTSQAPAPTPTPVPASQAPLPTPTPVAACTADTLDAAGKDADANAGQGEVGGTSSSCGEMPGGQPLGDLVITVINDEDPSDVMSGFTVQITGSVNDSQATDNSGRATFKSIPAGPYTYTQTNNCFVNPSPPPSANVAASSTNTADLHVRSNHSTLKIKQLVFTGNNPVENDTAGVFAPPEWVDGRAQTDQLPVSYARNKKIGVNATFTVTAAPTCTETVTVKGTATFGAASLELTASVTVNPGDAGKDLAPVSLTSNNPLPNKIDIFETTDITWSSQVASGGGVRNPAIQPLVPAGTTRNVIYVTLGDPAGSPNHWTLLDISCRAASGKDNENDFVSASFVPFTTHTGDGNGFKRKRDGIELTYYKVGAGTPSSGVFSCSDLLSRGDGTGRCGAWANFLVAMHQVHGVTSSAVLDVVPKFAPLLIVRNCTFNGAGSLPAPFTHKGQTECVKNDGIFGQGKNNPQFTFADHALVQHPTGIYDPSYGVGPKPDVKTWQVGGIAGLGGSATVAFQFGGNPHFM